MDVTCILINYNTSKYTLACIKSILENTKPPIKFEIIIVDNASERGDYEKLANEISTMGQEKIKLVRSKINTGFGGGNMMGVQNSENCKYYAFINNDTLLKSADIFKNLIAFMDANPDAGVCSPQMLYENGNFRKTLDHFSSPFREIFKRGTLEFLWPKRYPNRKKTYSIPIKVDYIQGAFMFVKASCFEKAGGFDTNLFLYYEEADLCRRLLKEQNKQTFLIPSLQYIHFESMSSSKNLKTKVEQKISLFYYIRKHFGWLAYKILQLYFSVHYFFSSIIKPKYWPLFILIVTGMPLSKSLKQKQQLHP